MPDSSAGDEELHGGTGEDQISTGATIDESAKGTEGVKESSSDAPAEGTKDEKKTPSILDAVRAALNKPEEEQSSGSGEGEDADSKDPTKTEGKTEEEEGEVEELTEEERKSLSAKAQRRFRQLTNDNKSLTEQMAQWKPAVEGWQHVTDFAKKARLSSEDINTGFNIMDLMKNKPMEAYEKLTPIYNTLRALVGDILPKDLQDQVTKGEIPMERAQELSRLRAAKGYDTARETVIATEQTEEQKRNLVASAEKLKNDVSVGITNWENRWKSSDPDYSRIHGRVMEAIELDFLKREKAGTLPKTAADAVKMVDAVKAKVAADLKKLLPNKTSITHINGSGATNGAKPVPKSSRDAIAQAVGAA